MLFPFHIPIYIPTQIWAAISQALEALRIVSTRHDHEQHQGQHSAISTDERDDSNGKRKPFVRFRFPMNFVTAPLIADLFLLAISAIGRKEVHDGTVGAFNISPIDIMVFFLTLAYIAMSIDASGLIRWLAYKVLQKGGKNGPLLYLYLYLFFFLLATYSGNDPVILSGTTFLAYITRVSSNISNPRAWIFAQFTVANIASAILVSSNPTNLVLAGAFNIKFIHYTANMVVPVIVTAIVLFPFLLYVIFPNKALIPRAIVMHELSDEEKSREPENPNIPGARTNIEWQEKRLATDEQVKLLYLQGIMNPYLNKRGVAFPVIIMAATLTTILVLNAASSQDHPVYWVTLPAAFVMLCFDLALGWHQRFETRDIARKGRQEYERVQAEKTFNEKEKRDEEAMEQQQRDTADGDKKSISSSTRAVGRDEDAITIAVDSPSPGTSPTTPHFPQAVDVMARPRARDEDGITVVDSPSMGTTPTTAHFPRPLDAMAYEAENSNSRLSETATTLNEKQDLSLTDSNQLRNRLPGTTGGEMEGKKETSPEEELGSNTRFSHEAVHWRRPGPATLQTLVHDAHNWTQETFPTAAAVLANLPFALVPFALSMFVLVQALVTKGWVPVFAHGWDHWVDKTGTVGSIGGMGFLSVVLCNVSSLLFMMTGMVIVPCSYNQPHRFI